MTVVIVLQKIHKKHYKSTVFYMRKLPLNLLKYKMYRVHFDLPLISIYVWVCIFSLFFCEHISLVSCLIVNPCTAHLHIPTYCKHTYNASESLLANTYLVDFIPKPKCKFKFDVVAAVVVVFGAMILKGDYKNHSYIFVVTI